MHVDTPQTRCRVGIARGDVTPPIGIYHRMWGAAVHDRATGIHRPLTATLLYLRANEGSSEQLQVIAAVDHCVIGSAEMANLRAAIGQAIALDVAKVHISL